MTAALPIKRVSYAEYLRMEARSDVRLEFVDGYVYAMTGGAQMPATTNGSNAPVSPIVGLDPSHVSSSRGRPASP